MFVDFDVERVSLARSMARKVVVWENVQSDSDKLAHQNLGPSIRPLRPDLAPPGP